MNDQQIADLIREKYTRLEYVLFTLVAVGKVLESWCDRPGNNSAEISLVTETINMLTDDLTEEELLSVNTIFNEVMLLGDSGGPESV